jgi:hypothetical protein
MLHVVAQELILCCGPWPMSRFHALCHSAGSGFVQWGMAQEMIPLNGAQHRIWFIVLCQNKSLVLPNRLHQMIWFLLLTTLPIHAMSQSAASGFAQWATARNKLYRYFQIVINIESFLHQIRVGIQVFPCADGHIFM